MAKNPFTIEVEAANKAAFEEFVAAASLSGDAAKTKLVQAGILTDAAMELTLASIEWRSGRLEMAIKVLKNLLARSAIRQSDIFGRLTELGEKIGVTLESGHETTKPIHPPFEVEVHSTAFKEKIDPEKRHASVELLHPTFRGKVEALLKDIATAKVPMVIFESYRTPERQDYLYAIGRTRETDRDPVTFVKAWHSYHQFGLAVDIVLDHKKTGLNPWETIKGDAPKWWKKFHELAAKNGLEKLSFELPHVQELGIKHSALMSGEQPGDGDESWESNFAKAVNRWAGQDKPLLPEGLKLERPSLALNAEASGITSAGIDWSALPKVVESNWMNIFGGQEWLVDANGIYIRDNPSSPLRTPGDPMTTAKIIKLYGDVIAEACQKFSLAPELVVMTIATETAAMKNQDFTGPETFRWEQNVNLTTTGTDLDGNEKGDYSAGPMQVLSNTARDVNNRIGLGYENSTDLKWFKNRPTKNPENLGLYDGKTCILIGTGYLSIQSGETNLNPILTAAAYNAGSARASGTNIWGLKCHGDHLDRASKWFSDACAVFATFGR